LRSVEEDSVPKKPSRFEEMLRRHGLRKPGATEAFPWGHRALKVRNKAFAFIVGEDDGTVTVSVKLPMSGYQALALPFVRPTEYGLGRAGWVTARIPPSASTRGIYARQALDWLDESYAAIAPKRLLNQPAKPARRPKRAARKA
jgi:predicted DNA-binding protein (MmcQ/YjbR family)